MQMERKKQKEHAPTQIPKPTTTAERITAEKQLRIMQSRLEAMEADTSEQWQRDANPGQVTEKNQLRAEINTLENSLLK